MVLAGTSADPGDFRNAHGSDRYVGKKAWGRYVIDKISKKRIALGKRCEPCKRTWAKSSQLGDI